MLVERGSPVFYLHALNRPLLVVGVKRELFFLFLGLTLPLVFAGHLLPKMDIIAIVLFAILHTAGVLITRADHQMLPIYRRHLHYRRYYAAQPGLHAKPLRPKPSVPVYQGQRGLV